MDAALARLVDQVQTARAAKGKLRIVGGGTKAFYGNASAGEPLDIKPLAGISSYEPSELVVTVRGGTRLDELEAALAEKGQCLPFEPPRLVARGTVGGMVAAGLAGPARASVGGVRDGPRGRIYLITQVLEGEAPTRATQPHLDRCLTCRNCESTCPSGVQYGHLVDIGRKIVEHKIERPAGERAVRWLLKEGLTSPLFAPAMKLGQMVRPHLPASMKNKVPAKGGARAHQWPQRTHARKVLMLMSCVQPAMMPNINAATARVLDAAGIQTLVADGAGCCGATVKDYAHHLAHDPHYAEKAQRISALTKDVSELLAGLVPALMIKLRSNQGPTNKLAFHPPRTLQHGQQLRGGVESGLRELGFDISVAANESHLCCGSAGTYSVTQLELSYQLRETASSLTWRRSKRIPSSAPTSVASSTCRLALPRRCATGSRRSTRRSRPESQLATLLTITTIAKQAPRNEAARMPISGRSSSNMFGSP